MSGTNTGGSFLSSAAHVARLGKGIHDNVVITKVDIEKRRIKGQPIKKLIYITYATVDPTTRKKKQEVELAWWELDPSSQYFFTNLRELLVQIDGILKCYMSEEDVNKAMENTFTMFDGMSVSDIEVHAWKRSELDQLCDELAATFAAAIKPFVGVSGPLIRFKLSLDYKGEAVAYPKYGIFTEAMTVDPTNLKFTDAELRDQSKAGNTTVKASSSFVPNV